MQKYVHKLWVGIFQHKHRLYVCLHLYIYKWNMVAQQWFSVQYVVVKIWWKKLTELTWIGCIISLFDEGYCVSCHFTSHVPNTCTNRVPTSVSRNYCLYFFAINMEMIYVCCQRVPLMLCILYVNVTQIKYCIKMQCKQQNIKQYRIMTLYCSVKYNSCFRKGFVVVVVVCFFNTKII